MVDSPSGGAPTKAPRWDLANTEGYSGGNCFLLAPWMFPGYADICRRKKLADGATRVEGAPPLLGAPPASWAPRASTDLLLPPIYTHVPREHQRRPQKTISTTVTSVSARSHLGAFAGTLPEGESTTEGFYINILAPPMSCE